MAKIVFDQDGSNLPPRRKHGRSHTQPQVQANGSSSAVVIWRPTSKPLQTERKSSLRSGLRPNAASFQLPTLKHDATIDDGDESSSSSRRRLKVLGPFGTSKVKKEKSSNHRSSYQRVRPTPSTDESKSRKQSLRSQTRRDVETSLDNIIRNAGRPRPQSHRDELSSSPEDVVPTWTSSFGNPGHHTSASLNSMAESSTTKSPFQPGQRWPARDHGSNTGSIPLDKSRWPSSSGLVTTRTSDSSMTDGTDPKRKASDQSMHDAEEISPGTKPEKNVHFAQNISGPSGTGQLGAKTPTKSAFTQTFAGFGRFVGEGGSTGISIRRPSKAARVEDIADDDNASEALRPIPTPDPTPKPKKRYSFGATSVHTQQPATWPRPVTPIKNTENLGLLLSPPAPSAQVLRPKQSHAFGVMSGYPPPAPAPRLPTPPTSPRRSPRFQNTQTNHADPEATVEYPAAPTHPSPARPLPETISNPSAHTTPTKTIANAELDYLRSELFDPSLIRPVPDLSQVFQSISIAFGEPGTGFLQNRYEQPLPQQSVPQKGAAVPTPREYEGWQYSCNPNLKSRQVNIELLRIRLTHAFLLSFNLDADARRDAIAIGDLAEPSSGLSTNLTGRTLLRDTNSEHHDRSGISKPTKGRGHIGRGLLAGASGNRRRNSNKDVWNVDAAGRRTRRRESNGDSDAMRERRINQQKRIAKAISEGDAVALRDASLESATSSGGLKGVRSSGSMNVLFWRLIRVSVVVEVDVKTTGRVMVEKAEEVQSAWWAVPERAVVGMF